MRCRSCSRPGGRSGLATASWPSSGSACRLRFRLDGSPTCGGSPAGCPSSEAALQEGANRALVSVLDGIGAQKSQRRMAERIWGEARVAEDWSSESWMRAQVRRWISKAKALPAGGWRDLVSRRRAGAVGGRVAAVRPDGKREIAQRRPPSGATVAGVESETVPRSGRIRWTCGAGCLPESACELKTDKQGVGLSHCKNSRISRFLAEQNKTWIYVKPAFAAPAWRGRYPADSVSLPTRRTCL